MGGEVEIADVEQNMPDVTATVLVLGTLGKGLDGRSALNCDMLRFAWTTNVVHRAVLAELINHLRSAGRYQAVNQLVADFQAVEEMDFRLESWMRTLECAGAP